MIRSILVLLVILFGYTTVCSQNKEVLYDFTEIPQALLLNPGMEVGFSWYAGVPFTSGIYGQAGTSGITVHDLFRNSM